MKVKKFGLATSMAMVVVVAISLLAGNQLVKASTCSGPPCWQVVSSPNVGSGTNILNSVYAVSSKNIWAVGEYLNSSNAA